MTPAKDVRQCNGDDTRRRQHAMDVGKQARGVAQVFEDVREDDQIIGTANSLRNTGFKIRDMNRLTTSRSFGLLVGADSYAVDLPSASRKDASVVAGAASAIESAAGVLRADEFEQAEIAFVLIGAIRALAMAGRAHGIIH